MMYEYKTITVIENEEEKIQTVLIKSCIEECKYYVYKDVLENGE